MITRSSSRSGKMESDVAAALQSIRQEMSAMNRSLDSLHEQVGVIKTELDTIKELKTALEFTDAKVTDVENSVSNIQKNINEQNDCIDKIEIKTNKIQSENVFLKEKLLQLETYDRRENLRFSGIQEEANESHKQTKSKIIELFSNTMEIKDSKFIKLQRCHRLGVKSSKHATSRDIIVRFAFFPDREEVWEHRQKLSGTNITMSEDFTAEIESRRVQLYPILRAAREKNHKCKLVVDKLIIDGRKYTLQTLDSLPDDIHPKTLHEKQTEKAVLFYGGYSIFSNFYKANFEIDKKVYNCCEQFFQCQKAVSAGEHEVALKIMSTEDPREQYRLGKNVNKDDKTWNKEKARKVMEMATKAKFDQNEPLKHELLKTGNKLLVQCNQYDKIWANGLNIHSEDADNIKKWEGENVTGVILTSIRDNLK